MARKQIKLSEEAVNLLSVIIRVPHALQPGRVVDGKVQRDTFNPYKTDDHIGQYQIHQITRWLEKCVMKNPKFTKGKNTPIDATKPDGPFEPELRIPEGGYSGPLEELYIKRIQEVMEFYKPYLSTTDHVVPLVELREGLAGNDLPDWKDVEGAPPKVKEEAVPEDRAAEPEQPKKKK